MLLVDCSLYFYSSFIIYTGDPLHNCPNCTQPSSTPPSCIQSSSTPPSCTQPCSTPPSCIQSSSTPPSCIQSCSTPPSCIQSSGLVCWLGCVQCITLKLRSHMRGAVAGGFWHSRSATAGMFTHMRGRRGRICHFLRTMMVWSARFRSGRGKLGVGPISCGADFAPAPPPLRDRACVNTCNDLCWSQFSARFRPRMCERTFKDHNLTR